MIAAAQIRPAPGGSQDQAMDQRAAQIKKAVRARRGDKNEARGIEITDDLDTEPVLLERHDSGLQRVLIRQRGEAVRDGGRAHYRSFLMQIAPGTEGPR
jgi:hypothetical protein